MKGFWLGVVLFALGIGAMVATGFMAAEDIIFGAMVVFCLGALLLVVGFSFCKGSVQILKTRLAEEKETGKKTTKRIITANIVVVALVLIIAVTTVLMIYGMNRASYLNNKASVILEESSATNISELVNIENEVNVSGPFVKLFFKYYDEIQEMKDSHKEMVDNRAAEVSEGIDALKDCKKITSASHYNKLSAEIEKLTLDPENEFDSEVLEQVSNYEKLIEHKEQVEKVRKRYEHKCKNCNGIGTFSCARCNGVGSKQCSYCGGSGKRLVEWYSEGDWGEVSYSNYDCTYCNSTGRQGCSCGNGKYDCEKCTDGKYYVYKNK